MSSVPRLLVIMGSGETSPTMSKVHREVFERIGPPPVPAVLLDTPFGFQENADIIAQRAVEYFAVSVKRDVAVASFRRATDRATLASETAMARLQEARWVFSGPGSPSYALRQWRSSPVPSLLAEKLRTGGCVVFASAAAATLGRLTVPVYEIYKVGQEPHWIDGLDLLSPLGLPSVVVPHFDNAEGGNHDTRYCYLGERRLSAMEAELDDDESVLGLDEHTGAVFDLEDGTVTVVGLGGMTTRVRGRSTRFEAGETRTIAEIRAGGGSVPPAASSPARAAATGAAASGAAGQSAPASAAADPLVDAIADARAAFDRALQCRDGTTAVQTILDLEQVLVDWSRDTLQSDHLDRGRATMRAMVVRLGEAAARGLRDPADVVGPFVDAVLDARSRARAGGRFDEADHLRDRLLEGGVEIRDGRDGTRWQLR